MSIIDERIVSLVFDNEKFEKNVSVTLGTLEKLNGALNLGGKTVDALRTATNKNTLGGLGAGVDEVRAKFSALEIMATTALVRITNSAITAGKNIAKALTIDPIKTGLQEYETKINAIQVIKANTRGKNSMKEITDALDELNTYADKTIYNFAQMTNNIGKFTAQGLDVQQAAKAVQGLANLAAASGASAEDMARATYQMSQALGGTIRKIDWNSLRNANMATTTLKETLIDVAKIEEDIDVKKMMEEKGGRSFEDTLEEGWLSGSLFTEAMNIYSGVYDEAQLKAKGFTDKQIKNFQDLAKMAEEAATEVKTFSQLYDVLKETAQSGWTQSWEYIIGDFDTAKKDLTALQVYFSGVIDAMSDKRNKVLKEWNEAGGREMGVETLKNAWKGLLSVLEPIRDAFKKFFPDITAKQLLDLSEKVRDFSKSLILSSGTAKKVQKIFESVFSVFRTFVDIFKATGKEAVRILEMMPNLGDFILETAYDISVVISRIDELIRNSSVLTEFGKLLEGFAKSANILFGVFTNTSSNGLDEFIKKIEKIGNALSPIANQIINIFKNTIGKTLSNLEKEAKKYDIVGFINEVLLGGLLLSVQNFVRDLSSAIDNFKAAFALKETADTLSNTIDALNKSIKAFISSIDASALLKEALAVATMAWALKTLSELDARGLSVGLGAVTALLVELSYVMNRLNMQDWAKRSGMTTDLIGFALSIYILAKALKQVSDLNPSGLAVGLAGVTACIEVMVVVMDRMSEIEGKMTKFAGQMIVLGIAVNIMAKALISIGQLNPGQLAVGVGGLVLCVELLVAASERMNNEFKSITRFGRQMILMAVAVGTMGIAAKIFASMSWNDLTKGAYGLLVTVTIITTAAKVMATEGTAIAKFGTEMIMMAAAVGLLAIVAKILTTLSPEQMLNSFLFIADGLLAMVIAMKLAQGTFLGATAILVVAGALTALIPALIALSHMNLKALAGSLGILFVAFVAFVGVTAMLTPAIPVIFLMSGALLVLAAAIGTLGVGIALFGTGMTTVVGALGAFALVSKEAVKAAVSTIKEFFVGVFTVFPKIGEGIANAVTSFITTISENADKIGNSIKTTLINIVGYITETVPTIVESIMALIKEVVKSLAQNGEEIATDLLDFILGILDALATKMPEIVEKVIKLFGSIIDAVKDQFSSFDSSSIMSSLASIGLLVAFFEVMSLLGTMAAGAMVGVLAFGGLIAELSVVLAALGALNQIPGLDWLVGEGGELLQKIGNSIGKFIGGIVGGIAEGATSSLPNVAKNLSDFATNLQPFITTISSIKTDVLDKVSALSKAILTLTAADFLTSIADFIQGGDSFDKMGKQLASIGDYISDFNNKASSIDGAVASLNKLKTAFDNLKSAKFDSVDDLNKALKTLISDGIESFGTEIESRTETVVGYVNKMLTKVINEVENNKSKFKTAFTALAASSTEGLNSGSKTAVNELSKNLVTATAQAGKVASSASKSMSNSSDYSKQGKNAGDTFAKGISSATSAVSTAAKKLSIAGSKGADASYSYWNSSGKYLVGGLVKGLEAKRSSLVEKAKSLAKAANKAFNDESDIHSPSKKWMWSAEMLVAGLVQGLENNANNVVKSSKNLANSAYDSMSAAMNRINDKIQNGFDSSPTITPVLDLSNVESGIGAIDGLLSNSATIGLNARVSNIDRLVNSRASVNADVVSALKALKDDQTVGNTYIIDGVTYDDGSNVSNAVEELFNAARIDRRS